MDIRCFLCKRPILDNDGVRHEKIAIFIFMENNPDLAKGFTKRDKAIVTSLWQELASSLNAAGPPNKELKDWKKVWTEWKSDIKKKLAHNKAEGRAAGGGPFTKYHLNPNDEAIVRICGMDQAVDGVLGVSFGLTDDGPDETSKIRRSETPYTHNTNKRPRTENISMRLSEFLDEENLGKKQMYKKIYDLIKIEKENASSFRRIYRAIEKGSESMENAVKDLTNQIELTSNRMLTVMQEKNEIKKKQLELELLKFEYQNQK